MTEPHSNPKLFLVGCPRSGTTLLQRILDHHPLLAVANDTHFVVRCVEKAVPEAMEQRPGVDADPPVTPELRETVLGYRRLPRLGLEPEEIAALVNGAGRYSEWIGRIYDLYANRRGKAYAGEKTPDFVRHLPWLSRCFPRARAIHLVRDGRDVALSLLDWARPDRGPGRLDGWAREPLATAAEWWRWQVLAGLDAERTLPADRLLTVRYEVLLAQPEAQLERICSFLEIPMDRVALEFHVGKTRNDPGASAKKNWLPPTKGLRDWRRDLSNDDLELFESIAGDALEAYGYSRASEGAPDSIASRARAHREWWRAHLDRREGKRRRRIERRRVALGVAR